MWNEYAGMVLTDNVNEQDYADFKEVFFTGAAAVFAVLLGDGSMPDQKKAELAQAMHEELKAWATKTALERMTMNQREN